MQGVTVREVKEPLRGQQHDWQRDPNITLARGFTCTQCGAWLPEGYHYKADAICPGTTDREEVLKRSFNDGALTFYLQVNDWVTGWVERLAGPFLPEGDERVWECTVENAFSALLPDDGRSYQAEGSFRSGWGIKVWCATGLVVVRRNPEYVSSPDIMSGWDFTDPSEWEEWHSKYRGADLRTHSREYLMYDPIWMPSPPKAINLRAA